MAVKDLPPGVNPTEKKRLMAEDPENCPVPYIVQRNPDSFQARVFPWTLKTFGPTLTLSLKERRQRVAEESVELLQSCGASKEEIIGIVEHVMSRPMGEPRQEAAGLQVCLAALCNTMNINMDECREEEFERCKDKVSKIRDKNLMKPTF